MMPRRREPMDGDSVMGCAALGLFIAFLRLKAEYHWATESLRRVRSAQSTTVSGLRSIITDSDCGETLVSVRGHAVCKLLAHVKPPPSANCCSCCPKKNDDYSHLSTQAAILTLAHQWLFDNWDSQHHTEEDSRVSLELVPLALVEGDQYVRVIADRYRPLPTEEFLRHMHLVQSPSYPFLSFLDHLFICNEERIVQIDMEINALGICRNRNGALEIESSRNIPHFLSAKTKNFIEEELTARTENYLWGSVVSGAISIGIICYAIFRSRDQLSLS